MRKDKPRARSEMARALFESVKRALARLGYDIRRIDPARQQRSGYTLHTYQRADGTFDYEKYKRIQIEGNIRKEDRVWVIEENIAFLSRYIERVVGPPSFGLCHGTRRGLEQAWFKKYLNCHVLGTEISDTAGQYPDTIQWDFHEVKPEWAGAVDFIYSNAFDHSYDPEKCLDAWMSCLKRGGICILEHSSSHTPAEVSMLDPFGADIAMMPYLIVTWGKGAYGVRQILEAPKRGNDIQYLFFIIVQKWQKTTLPARP